MYVSFSCAVECSCCEEADMALICSLCCFSAGRPACLSVRWPQDCFYKCRSHCSIALQPNRITRLFPYSWEVEQRERLALPLLPIKSLCQSSSRSKDIGDTFPSLWSPSVYHFAVIFPHLLSLSRLYQTPCPHCPLPHL